MWKLTRRMLVSVICCGCLWMVAGCPAADGEPDTNQHGVRQVRVIPIDFDQTTVIPSSVLRFGLRGTDRLVTGQARIRMQGVSGAGKEIEHVFDVEAQRKEAVGDLFLTLDAGVLWPLFQPSPRASFRGSMEIELRDEIGLLGRGLLEDVALEFETEFYPQVEPVRMGAVFANHAIEISGENFLRPEEGTTWAIVEEGYVHPAGGQRRSLAQKKLAVQWTGSRSQAVLALDPVVFGVQEAEFELDLRFENELQTGVVFEGNRQQGLSGSIQQTYIAALAIVRGSRGQKVGIIGRGFVPMEAESGYGMLLRYEGILTPEDSTRPALYLTGNSALDRVPDRVVREDLLEMSVWYHVEERTLSGFGAEPGVFRGTITPILFDAYGEQQGQSWEGEFTILPTLQVVYLKYLPAFSKALEKYGLENVERDIRDRILEVVRRDYAGVNIRFDEKEPADFLEYSTIELGGPDPSGNAAFGYDNTFNLGAKDTGNLYLSDYLGGLNVQSGTEYNNPYGGIFIESFSSFSPTLHPSSQYTSPHFDRIMKPFMPQLGGKAVLATEWPDGARAAQIQEAIWMVGNVIGNTVSHEIGHSLGMTFDPRDWEEPIHIFHNPVPEGCIMDSGEDRPFEQRAEIEGVGPARFSARNRQYLEVILPVR